MTNPTSNPHAVYKSFPHNDKLDNGTGWFAKQRPLPWSLMNYLLMPLHKHTDLGFGATADSYKEAADHLRLGALRFQQNLHRQVTAKIRIAAFQYGSHSAPSDLTKQLQPSGSIDRVRDFV